jgi:23S rRNA pseudouridine1911/1915/1917 synthase
LQDISTQVLFEDNHIIAINKLPSQIVQGDKTGDTPLSELVKNYLKEKYQKPGNVFAGVIHRIDRPVSGVVLFARTSKALARMNEMLQQKKIQKTYWAIVKNKPETESATLKHYMKKNEKNNKSYTYNNEIQGSKLAILEYQLIKRSDNYHLLEVKLHTGRHHQIRAQLAAIGSPIKGDLKYGFDRSNKDGSICLHAIKAEFIHPVKNEPVIITAPPPPDSLWNYFNQ